jgi:hypothetical protein
MEATGGDLGDGAEIRRHVGLIEVINPPTADGARIVDRACMGTTRRDLCDRSELGRRGALTVFVITPAGYVVRVVEHARVPNTCRDMRTAELLAGAAGDTLGRVIIGSRPRRSGTATSET